jgi:hypothetical protein
MNYAERFIDDKTTRGIVLAVLRAYGEPSEQSEKQIEGILPLLQHAVRPEVRAQAAKASRLWLGTKFRDPIRYRRLMFYRLRHLDNALNDLEKMTRPRKKAQ